MKRNILIITLMLVGMIDLQAQIDEELSIMKFMEDIQLYIDQIEKDDYSISKLEFDLVTSRGTKSTPVKLIDDQNYKILINKDCKLTEKK